MTEKEQVLRIFPKELRNVLGQVPLGFEGIQELRLRAGRPFLIVCKGREYMVGDDGRTVETGFLVAPGAVATAKAEGKRFRPLVISQEQVRETVEFMGSFSLYAAEEELRQGFLTIQGGHRVGVAGRTVAQGDFVRLMKNISFLNVRVAHQLKGCADGVMDRLFAEDGHFLNTLIISPPRCGKTTLLRDIIRQVSDGHVDRQSRAFVRGMTVGVVDERSELAACYQGVPQNDLGMRTDVLDCCPKSQGMMMLVRTMAPAVVAVDEIGGSGDAAAVEYALSCGCSLAATVHAGSLEEVRQKLDMGRLLEQKAFKRYILLDSQGGAGHVSVILDENGAKVQEAR